MVASGSAPISPQVMDFLKIAFSCEVAEGMPYLGSHNCYGWLWFSQGGIFRHFYLYFPLSLPCSYGMTENCATCTKTWSDDSTASGTVGPPLPVNELKVIDVSAMGYTSEDKPNPRGELCMRGANCFTTYYKGMKRRNVGGSLVNCDLDEKNTKETVDAEGWIHTGDVAEIDSCGRVKIVDRIKVSCLSEKLLIRRFFIYNLDRTSWSYLRVNMLLLRRLKTCTATHPSSLSFMFMAKVCSRTWLGF